jgi:hypothetical protein
MRSTQSLEAVLQTMMVVDRLPNEPETLATQPPLVATHHPAVPAAAATTTATPVVRAAVAPSPNEPETLATQPPLVATHHPAVPAVVAPSPDEPETLATQPPLVATHHPAGLMMRTWFGVEADHLQEINVISLAISKMEMGLWTLVR